MRLDQHRLQLTTRRDLNTGLKATALTNILNIQASGHLKAIYMIDPDDLAQNERLQITLDDVIIFNDAAINIPNTDYWLDLLHSLSKSVAVQTATANITQEQPISFARNLKVDYLRAAAGTTGLTINILFDFRGTILIDAP